MAANYFCGDRNMSRAEYARGYRYTRMCLHNRGNRADRRKAIKFLQAAGYLWSDHWQEAANAVGHLDARTWHCTDKRQRESTLAAFTMTYLFLPEDEHSTVRKQCLREYLRRNFYQRNGHE